MTTVRVLDAPTALDPERYRDLLAAESARFRQVLAECEPTSRVPGCPEWDAGDLLWHLADVQWFWATVLARRPRGPEGLRHPARPPSHDELVAHFDASSRSLIAELGAADPRDPAWTWAPDRSVGFILRRQAHEALIHRLDAEQSAGTVTPLDPELAADGVHEVLSVMHGGVPEWATWEPLGAHLRVDCADTDDQVWVELGRLSGTDPDTGEVVDEEDVRVVPAREQEPDVVVEGTAEALDAWLWQRGDADALHVVGDPAVHRRVVSVLGQPLD